MRKALTLAFVLASAAAVWAAAVWAAADAPRKMGAVKIVTLGLVVNLKGEHPKPGRKSNDSPLKEVPLPEGTYDVASIQLFAQAVRKGKPEVWSLESAEELGGRGAPGDRLARVQATGPAGHRRGWEVTRPAALAATPILL